MDPITKLAATILFVSSVMAGVLFGFVWPNYRKPNAQAVLCLLAACGIWAFFYAVEIIAPSFWWKVLAAQLQYVGIVFVAPSWCVAAIYSSGLSRHLSVRRLTMLLVIPFFTLAAAFTNSFHHLLWREIAEQTHGLPTLHFRYGPVFWINNQYAWLLLILGTVLLLREIAMSQPLFYGQRILMLFTVLIPWMANAAYVFNVGPISGLDLTPCAFVVSGSILFVGIVRYKLPDVVPIARTFVLEMASDGVFVLDSSDKLIDINRVGRDLLGASAELGLGTDARKSFSSFPALVEILNAGPGTVIRFTNLAGPRTQTYEARVDSLSTDAGTSLGRVVTCRNVTGEAKAVAQLEERENHYRILFEESPIALWLEDFSGVHAFFEGVRKSGVTDWNSYFRENPEAVRECADRVKILDVNARAIVQHAAADKEELLGSLLTIFTDQSIEVFRDELVSLAQGHTSFRGEAEHKTASGEMLWVSLNLRVVPGFEDSLKRVLISNIDITQQKRAEERRIRLERHAQQAQKLESLGVLAGGIAHDFNNILVAIIGNASLTLADLSPSSPMYNSIHEIESAAHKAADLCQQMLAYAGKGKFRTEPLDLEVVLRNMMPLLKSSVSKKVVLSVHKDENIPAVEGDATQIEQVVMNLVVNASESLGENVGSITVSIGRESCTRERLSQLPYAEHLPESEYVYIEVTDNGCGMNEDTLARLFEPFFSTKFAGRGLGMSVVLGIVRGHGGTLDVQSQVGTGTRIRILLPALACAMVRPSKDIPTTDVNPKIAASILLVDDEEIVRSVCSRMLERIGATVLTAADGSAALEMFKAHRNEIALVLLDFKMPKLDGIETYSLMRQIDPKVKVVLSSGYTEDEIASHCSDLGLAGFMQKPYTLDTLRDRIVPLLDAVN